jgi:hypothetical protein
MPPPTVAPGRSTRHKSAARALSHLQHTGLGYIATRTERPRGAARSAPQGLGAISQLRQQRKGHSATPGFGAPPPARVPWGPPVEAQRPRSRIDCLRHGRREKKECGQREPHAPGHTRVGAQFVGFARAWDPSNPFGCTPSPGPPPLPPALVARTHSRQLMHAEGHTSLGPSAQAAVRGEGVGGWAAAGWGCSRGFAATCPAPPPVAPPPHSRHRTLRGVRNSMYCSA